MDVKTYLNELSDRERLIAQKVLCVFEREPIPIVSNHSIWVSECPRCQNGLRIYPIEEIVVCDHCKQKHSGVNEILHWHKTVLKYRQLAYREVMTQSCYNVEEKEAFTNNSGQNNWDGWPY